MKGEQKVDLITTLNQGLSQSLYPGHRMPKAKGWELAEKYPIPRDCEAVILDSDPDSDYIYMKVTDANGGEQFERYKIVPDPIPRFEPGKYVTINDFNSFKEEILDGINSLKQSLAAANDRSARSNGGGKQSGRPNNEFGKPESNIQPDGFKD